MKKIIASILSLALTVSCISPAFAASNIGENGQETVVETETSRSVTTMDEQYVYSTVYYFESEHFDFVQSDRETGEVLLSYSSSENNVLARSRTEETFSGYAYYITNTSSGEEYKLNMPWVDSRARFLWVDTVYFKAYRTTYNSQYLDDFTEVVDELDDLEKAFIVAAGAAIGASVLNFFAWASATGPITGALITSFTGALGLTAAEYLAAEAVATCANKCRNAWDRAENNCRGVFY